MVDHAKSLGASDYRKVAQVHAASINRGFLSSLGERFLALLYEAIDADRNSILIVSKASAKPDVLVGLIASEDAVVARIPETTWTVNLLRHTHEYVIIRGTNLIALLVGQGHLDVAAFISAAFIPAVVVERGADIQLVGHLRVH